MAILEQLGENSSDDDEEDPILITKSVIKDTCNATN